MATCWMKTRWKKPPRTTLVFHPGALISIPYSYQHPVEVVRANILGTLAVLQACRKAGCRVILRLPVKSTAPCAYRLMSKTPLQGQSPYSASKIGADKLVESYYRAFGVPPSPSGRSTPMGRVSPRAVIPTIITQALRRKKSIGKPDALGFHHLDDTVARSSSRRNPELMADL